MNSRREMTSCFSSSALPPVSAPVSGDTEAPREVGGDGDEGEEEVEECGDGWEGSLGDSMC